MLTEIKELTKMKTIKAVSKNDKKKLFQCKL
jgi:hypothetical protein